MTSYLFYLFGFALMISNVLVVIVMMWAVKEETKSQSKMAWFIVIQNLTCFYFALKAMEFI